MQLPATNIMQPYGDRIRDSYVPMGPETMYQSQQQQRPPQWITDQHGTHFNNWQQQQQPPMLPQEMSMNSMQQQQQQQSKAIFGQVPGQVPGNWVPVRQGPVQEQEQGQQTQQSQGQIPIIAQVPVANVVPQGSLNSGDASGQKSNDVGKDSDSKDESTSEEEDESDNVTTETPKVSLKHHCQDCTCAHFFCIGFLFKSN